MTKSRFHARLHEPTLTRMMALAQRLMNVCTQAPFTPARDLNVTKACTHDSLHDARLHTRTMHARMLERKHVWTHARTRTHPFERMVA